MKQNRFNLVDEPWIPVADRGLASLHDVFTDSRMRSLGGSPVNKIAIFKLLQAIAQAACTPSNDEEWKRLGATGLMEACVDYLCRQRDAFWLYGDRPFLQMPSIARADLFEYGVLMPEIATGNTTRVTGWQTSPPVLTDAQLALLLVTNLSCCLGGKKGDKTFPALSKGFEKKASAAPGPALCSGGLLHSFLTGQSLAEGIWMNLLTSDQIAQHAEWTGGLGTPPWERMPEGEDCPVARRLKESLMGRLVPLARFIFLDDGGLHLVEGIRHGSYLEGFIDPSVTADTLSSKTKVLWSNPQKRPWRSLTAMLAFLEQHSASSYQCYGVKYGISRLHRFGGGSVGLWCGGVKVSSNAGEQYLSGMDDFVESEFQLDSETMYASEWFPRFESSMLELDKDGKALYGAVLRYYGAQMSDSGKDHAEYATSVFWQKAEQEFQAMLDACAEGGEAFDAIGRRMKGLVYGVYDDVCPNRTARQIQAWAQCKPRFKSK